MSASPPKMIYDPTQGWTLNPDWQNFWDTSQYGQPGGYQDPGLLWPEQIYSPLFSQSDFATPEAYLAMIASMTPGASGSSVLPTWNGMPDPNRAARVNTNAQGRTASIYGESSFTFMNWVMNNPAKALELYFAFRAPVDPATGGVISAEGMQPWLSPEEMRAVERVLGPDQINAYREQWRAERGLNDPNAPGERTADDVQPAQSGRAAGDVQTPATGPANTIGSPSSGAPPQNSIGSPTQAGVMPPAPYVPDRSTARPVAVPEMPPPAPTPSSPSPQAEGPPPQAAPPSVGAPQPGPGDQPSDYFEPGPQPMPPPPPSYGPPPPLDTGTGSGIGTQSAMVSPSYGQAMPPPPGIMRFLTPEDWNRLMNPTEPALPFGGQWWR